MNIRSRIFGALRPAYMIRAYVIGFALFAFMAWVRSHGPSDASNYLLIGYFLVCSLIFPFAKFVWDEVMALLMGRNFFIMPAIFLIPLKVLVNGLLWTMAIFVAPLGILYLWFRTGDANAPGE